MRRLRVPSLALCALIPAASSADTSAGGDQKSFSGVTSQPAEFKVYLPGGIPLVLVRIPAGTYSMGSPDEEKARWPNEGPQHEVTLTKDFYLGKYEVTQEQWQAVMGWNNSTFTECGPDCPVEMVSWNEVCGGQTGSSCAPSSFIGRLNQLTGVTAFRLPTEAEWEYAARAGTTTEFSFPAPADWGEICYGFPEAEAYMWWCGNGYGTTHPVGELLPNNWGLYDVHGNVGELTADRYDDDYYEVSPAADPPGPSSGPERVVRGGGWTASASGARSAFRWPSSHDWRDWRTGFRLALSPGGDLSYHYWLQIAAHLGGAAGSQWRTDVVLRNTTDEPVEVQFILHTDSGDVTMSGTVEASAQGIFEDIVSLMGAEGSKGALEIVSNQPLEVVGRIFNQGPEGSFGQYMGGATSDSGMSAGQSARLLGLRQLEGSYRTNLQLTNAGAVQATVQVRLFSTTGLQLVEYSVAVEVGRVVQDEEPFKNKAGLPNLGWGYARVEVLQGSGILASASVVDSRTNDATTVPMHR